MAMWLMITARIRKFMRKTGRSIDLQAKDWITFENRANGRNEKEEFDAEPVTICLMALTGVEQDDWSIEFDAEHIALLDTIDRNKVIIGDWVDSDDEETNVSESQKETAFNSENSETSFENRVTQSKQCLVKKLGTRDLGKQRGGSRETRPVWNNIQRVNHSNFSKNSRYPHQRRSFTPSAVLTRDGLISTARPTINNNSTSKYANVTYHGYARSRKEDLKGYAIIDSGCWKFDRRQDTLSDFKDSKELLGVWKMTTTGGRSLERKH
ncbi:hypothetical protein Tco_0873931 [Tanacetum coccineum]|uniref:Uncharacterized protein n=1 Tax=Tanacetum coccineum TaxID=301880 RepID=A0ABQ5BK78_9ASTR